MPTPKLRLPVAVALALALPCGAAFAASHITDITWSADGRFAHQTQIAAGKFIEACGKLAPGESVRWSFTTAQPVDFNIHYHRGKEAVFPVKQTQVSSARDALKVTVSEDHCWMWTNKGQAPVSLSFELVR